jgi:hypothetical protein
MIYAVTGHVRDGMNAEQTRNTKSTLNMVSEAKNEKSISTEEQIRQVVFFEARFVRRPDRFTHVCTNLQHAGSAGW